MYTEIIAEKEITFKELEKEILEKVYAIGREMLKKVLESYDKQLLQELQDKEVRNKGLKKTVIKTIMGEVEYQRRIYKLANGKHEYLLDKKLGITSTGKMSENLVEKLIDVVEIESYRKAADTVSKLTGQRISHEAARTVVIKTGEKIEKKEKEQAKLHKQEKLEKGNKEVASLFEEADGLYVSLQGKDRAEAIERQKKQAEKQGKEYKKPKKFKAEMKLHVSYEGRKKVSKNRNRIEGKSYTVGFTEAKELKSIKEAKIAGKYKVESIQKRILGGDGAGWIKKIAVAGQTYQLDEFHIKQAINRKVKEEKDREVVKKMFDERRYKEIAPYLEKLKYEYGGESSEVRKLTELQSYLKIGLERYWEVTGELPKLAEGLEYGRLGVMETQIFTVLVQRFRGRKAFSKAGATKLAKVIALKKEKKGKEILEEISTPIKVDNSIEEYIQEIENNMKVTIKELMTRKTTKKSGIRTVPMPYEGQPRTEGRKAIRTLVSVRDNI